MRKAALASVTIGYPALMLGLAVGASAAGQSARPLEASYIVEYHSAPGGPAKAIGEKTDRLERLHDFESRLRYRHALGGFAARLSREQVGELRRDPLVASITPDGPVHATGSVAIASGENVPPGMRRIGAADAATTHEASGVNVAVIDTGIDLDHPDLTAENGTDCIGSGSADDDNGHGTHVAGTIAAQNDGAGVIGVAPGTHVYAVKVLDDQGDGHGRPSSAGSTG